MANVFKKYRCLTPGCNRWKMKAGECPACKAPLHEDESYSISYRYIDAEGIRRKKVETAKTKSIRAAQRFLEQRISDAKNNQVSSRSAAAPTLGDVAEDYQKLVSIKHADEGKRDGYSWAHLKKHPLSKLPIDKILEKHGLQYINHREEQGASKGTIQKEFAFIKRVWKYARRNHGATTDPFADIRTHAPQLPPMRPVSKEQIEQLWAALPASSLPYYQFVALTGCRMTEALNLTWDKIEWKEQIAWVNSAKNRQGISVREPVHLSKKAIEILKKLQKRDLHEEHIFVNPITGKPYSNPKSVLRRAIKKLGLPMRSVHDLRHLFASRLIESGVDNITASKLMRHKDPRQIMRYTHLSGAHMQNALESSQNDNPKAEEEDKESSVQSDQQCDQKSDH